MTVEKTISEKTSESTPKAPRRVPRSYSRWKRVLSILNLCVIVFLSFYIVVVLNLVVFRHPERVDLTFERIHTLSDASKERLELINQPVEVVIPYFFQRDHAVHRIQREIFSRARLLLNEFQALQPRIVLAHELNIALHDDSLEWAKLCEEHGFDSDQVNRFYFLTKDENPFRQIVTVDDLALYDRPTSPLDSTPPKIHKFRAEEAFVNALTRLIRREMPRVFFTRDSGELRPGEQGQSGIYKLARDLKVNGYDVHGLNLRRVDAIPAECDLLVIAGASEKFEVSERQKIQDYLEREGRLWVALGPLETGIESVLSEWGVEVVPGQILQKQVAIGGVARWSHIVTSNRFSALHPISAEFSPQSFEVLGLYLRPLDPQDKHDFGGEMLLSSPLKPETFVDTNGNRFVDESETEGASVIFAATVSQPIPDRPPPEFQHQATRIAVFGGTALLTNAWVDKYSHRDLVLNTVRWLLGQEEEMTGELDKSWSEQSITRSASINSFIFWVPIFLFPGVVLGIGLSVYFFRRS